MNHTAHIDKLFCTITIRNIVDMLSNAGSLTSVKFRGQIDFKNFGNIRICTRFLRHLYQRFYALRVIKYSKAAKLIDITVFDENNNGYPTDKTVRYSFNMAHKKLSILYAAYNMDQKSLRT